jgi:hypothetical protein
MTRTGRDGRVSRSAVCTAVVSPVRASAVCTTTIGAAVSVSSVRPAVHAAVDAPVDGAVDASIGTAICAAVRGAVWAARIRSGVEGTIDRRRVVSPAREERKTENQRR